MVGRSGPAHGPGPTPAHWLAALPAPAYYPALARALARVARGLHATHQARVAHRDVKPENILLEAGGAGRAYLIDFGIARDLDVATPEQLRDGAGSSLYMAPERPRGAAGDERRADIYSLGVTLYEAATLTRPLRVPAGLDRRLLGAFLARQRPAPPGAVRPGLPAALAAILARAMAADPPHRYATAAVLAAALERFARPWGRVGARWARRRAARDGVPL